MAKTITIPDDAYTRLEEHAAARGLTVEQAIARLVQDVEDARIAVTVERMRAEGLLLTPQGSAPAAPAGFKPVPVQGQPVSETIIEERR